MGRSRRSGKANQSAAKAIGILLLGGFAIWLLAQIWLFLLAAAGLALLGWLGWTVAMKLRDAPRPVQLQEAKTPSVAPKPQSPYRALVLVAPNSFDDPARTEAAAISVFEAWLQDLPMAPRHAAALVRSLQLRRRSVGRLLSEVVERQASWQESPARKGQPIGQPPFSLEAAIQSPASVESIRSDSRYIASCAPCQGKGVVTCPSCQGTTKGICSECSGSGKAYGIAKNGSRRVMNCKSCSGGKEDVRCRSCVGGVTTCTSCKGSGRIERWLEVIETLRFDIQVEPDGDVTRAFRWGKDGVAAARSEVEKDAAVMGEVSAEGTLSIDAVRKIVPADWLATHWKDIQPRLRGQEVVRRQSFWLLDVPSVEISYGLPGSPPTQISFEGRQLLAPPASLETQLAPRADRIRLLRYVLAGVLIVLPFVYMLRGVYFLNRGLAALWIGVALLAVVLDGFVRTATLGMKQARHWAVAAAVVTLGACACAFVLEPSVRSVRRQLAAGRLQDAERELHAIDAEERGSQRELWSELRLAQVQQATDLASAAKASERLAEGTPQIRAANQHMLKLGQAAVQQALIAHDADLADKVVAQLATSLRKSPEQEPFLAATRELKALVAEQRLAGCAAELCRFLRAREADQAARTPDRMERLERLRASLLQALEFREQSGEAKLERLKRLRTHEAYATLLANESDDEVIGPKASQAMAWAAAQRGKVPLLGEERSVVAELLGASDQAAPTLAATRAHVSVTAVLRQGRCSGLYLVGDSKDARVLDDGAHASATAMLLSQAFGHPVPIPPRPQQANGRRVRSMRRVEGTTPVVARWSGEGLVELRIGESTP